MRACPPGRCGRRAHPFDAVSSPKSLFDAGIGVLVLGRGATPHHVAMASFLLDVFCLGVKDVMFESLEGEEFDLYLDAMDTGSPLVPVDPTYARKLLRDLAAWSQSIGFAPHRDFAAAEQIFGDVNADASDSVFPFSRDGKPVYIPGPNDTAPLVRRRIELLQRHLGDGGFDFETAA
jgi:hypothetical protein